MDIDALRKQKQQRKQTETSNLRSKCSDRIHDLDIKITCDSPAAAHHYYLAQCYYDGIEGYEEDIKKAYEEFLKAAELGHLHAMVEVGCDYCSLTSILGYDVEKAKIWGNKALENGNVDGYSVLAGCMGKGEEEIKMLELGISKGSQSCIESMAQDFIYGREYIDGYELQPNKERAFQLLKNVDWDQYHTYGLEMLGNLYKENNDNIQAKNCYERILKYKPHDFSIMYLLGDMLRTEKEVIDLPRSKELLLIAAKGGNFNAMNSYGVMLYLGEGIEKDVQSASEWFKKAAQNGSHQAMINLYDILSDKKPDEAIYWLNRAAKEGSEEAQNRLQEMRSSDDSTDSIDTSRSDKIYDNFLNNLENTLNLSPSTVLNSGFPNRIEGIQKVIEKGDLSDYEVDRLKILQGWLSLCYFRHHFLDDDFDEQEQEYYQILDKVDDYVRSMTTISDEAAYLYNLANMYSAARYKDTDPEEKLEELWNQLSEIELDENETEFTVQFWEDTAQEVYDLMSEILNSNSNSSDSIDSYEEIKEIVIPIVADKLNLDEDEVHLYSRLVQDLGIDSLDAVDLIMEMENVFDIIIPDEDAERIRTVGDIISYIRAHS